MSTMGKEQLFFKIVFWFMLCTTIIGIFNLANEGTLTLGNFGVDTIPGQVGANTIPTTGATSTTIQDYTDPATINYNITRLSTWTVAPFSAPLWTQNSFGLTCTNLPLIPIAGAATVDIMGVTKNSAGVYDTIYYINNSVGEPFYLILWSGGQAIGFMEPDALVAKFDSNGIHIVRTTTATQFAPDILPMVPFSGADITGNNNIPFETRYNPTDNTAEILINGISSRFQGLPPSPAISNGITNSYGGFMTFKTGFTVQKITGAFDVASEEPGFDPVASFMGLLAAGAGFLALVGTIIGLGNNPIVPAWFWALITGAPIATLLYMNLELLRGTA